MTYVPRLRIGRATANEWLKRFRHTSPANEIDLTDDEQFDWRAYLQNHKDRRNIISESGIESFLWRRFPQIRDPGEPGLGARCDYVVVRVDGTAARLHPHANSEDQVGVSDVKVCCV